MFQTTVWEVVQAAGAGDQGALATIAEEYRTPILQFLRGRGVNPAQAEDLCQDVFVRLLTGGVLAKADPDRGRFRSLLCTVTIRVMQDWSRRHREIPAADDLDPAAPMPSFDRLWTLYLVERAFARLKETSPASYEALRDHLGGQEPPHAQQAVDCAQQAVGVDPPRDFADLPDAGRARSRGGGALPLPAPGNPAAKPGDIPEASPEPRDE